MLVPMAKAGHMVTGLDFDEFMLAKIPEKISNEEAVWYKADVIQDSVEYLRSTGVENGHEIVLTNAKKAIKILSI